MSNVTERRCVALRREIKVNAALVPQQDGNMLPYTGLGLFRVYAGISGEGYTATEVFERFPINADAGLIILGETSDDSAEICLHALDHVNALRALPDTHQFMVPPNYFLAEHEGYFRHRTKQTHKAKCQLLFLVPPSRIDTEHYIIPT